MRSAVITCFFNAMDYESRRQNYAVFAARLRKQKVPLYTIEAIFPGQRSQLAGFANVETITCEAVLWQKESLLNALIRRLDKKYRGIIWCDADILFENANWYRQVCRMLERKSVVQPFGIVARLPRGKKRYVRTAELYTSFGSVYAARPQILTQGDFAAHGHTGFAWAARREVIADAGLYDAMIAGSGDHVMAHAFAGDFSSECIYRILANNPRHIEHFTRWARNVYPHVRGRIGCVPGRILHLWHGETENRRYVQRNRELASFGFDPARDLVRDERGLWKWGRQRKPLAVWAKNYFALRKEDG